MAIRVPSAEEVAAKWARVTATRQTDYEAGVKDTEVDWAANTASARESFEQGVTAAIQRGAFQRGVAAVGNDRWRRKTVEVGGTRWAPGVRAATDDMRDGVRGSLETIARVALPPRAPKGDPRNLQRVEAVTRALAEARMRG